MAVVLQLRSLMRLLLAQRALRLSLVLGPALVAACGPREAPHSAVVIATAADADALLPPITSNGQSRAVYELLFDRLADLGPSLNTVGDSGFVPRLARRWEWSRDSLEITFHLDPRARWQDGQPVRATDVRFAFELYTDSRVHSAGGADLRAAVDSVSVDDSVTCTAWFHRRSLEQFFTFVYTLIPLPEHLLEGTPRDSLRTAAFARNPVGDGPYRLVRWDPRQRIEIAAVDSFYRGRARIDRVVWSIMPEMTTAVEQLFSGGADFFEALSPDDARAVASHPNVRAVPYGSLDYNYLQFNLHDQASSRPHPLFADRALRRALTMALDRSAMVRSVFGALGAVGLGPFVRAQWSADTTLRALPFDRAAAARTLDSLGWRAGPGSTRTRSGRSLSFTLLVPSSSKNREQFAVLIQEQLRQVGVRVDIESLDFNALSARIVARRFDAFLGGLHASPSPSGSASAWKSSTATVVNGMNFGGYASAAYDAQVDSAIAATDRRSAMAHYRAAYQDIIDDAPVIWLYEPTLVAGVSTRVNVGTLRPDAWWSGVPSWTVRPGGAAPRPSRTSP